MLKGRNVLWEVARPVLGWPLRSPLRLLMVVAVVCLVGALISQLRSEEAPQAGTDQDQVTATVAPGDDEAAQSAPVDEEGDQVAATAVPGDEVGGPTADTDEVEVTEEPTEEATEETVEEPSGEAVEVGEDDGHGHDDDDSWETIEPGDQMPVFDPKGEVEEEIAALAVEAAVAMARPGEDDDTEQWWEEFSGHLTEKARGDYEGVDPQQVPYTEVDTDLGGKMLPRPADTPDMLRLVQVETDTGPVTVWVQREGEGWAVSRISWTDIWSPDR